MSEETFTTFDEINQKRSEFLGDAANLSRTIDLRSTPGTLSFSGLIVDVREEYFHTRSLGAALAVAETIGKLYLMKTKADAADAEAKALQEIAQKIAAIETRLGKIESQLDDIRNELNGLSVRIDELPALAAVNVLRGRVDVIVDFIAAWANNPKDPAIRPQITQNFGDIAQSVRTQMRHGYAHSLDVFIGFSFELELAFLLGYKVNDIKPSINRVIRYAADLFDAGQSGSIGAVLVSIEAEMKRLESEDTAINRSPVFLGSKFTDNCCGDGAWVSVDYYCQVKGDIKNGYSITNPNRYGFGYCSCDGHWLRTESDGERESCSCGNAEAEAEFSARGRQACPYDEAALNRKAVRYDFLTQTKSSLEALKRQIRIIKTNIEARAAWQSDFDT